MIQFAIGNFRKVLHCEDIPEPNTETLSDMPYSMF